MFHRIMISVLLLFLCAVLISGCGSSYLRELRKLTSAEKSPIKTLILMDYKEEVSIEQPYLAVSSSATGTKVRILGSSMTYEEFLVKAKKSKMAIRDCLETAYGDKKYAFDRFKSLLSELITPDDSILLIIASKEDREQLGELTKEEIISFLKKKNADAVLMIQTNHLGGAKSKPIAYTGIRFRIDGSLGKRLYMSKSVFTNIVNFDENKGFCKEFIDNFEAAVDKQTQRMYNTLVGSK